MDSILDDHGQPINRLYNRKRLNDRAIDEMIGMARGIVADATVNHQEARVLLAWMVANVSFCEDWTVNSIYRRIHEMLIDGVLDADERQELLGILSAFSGASTLLARENMAAWFPLCQPPPVVEIPTMGFCLTGSFAYGPRRECEAVIEERGGRVEGYITKAVDYLVIGTFSSTDWAHTAYGRKIEKAVEYREKFGRPAIISEDLWADISFRM
ncbi:MAG: BRCT domain-containing protein [Desulfobulbaceae bacterium]|nr:BRCT domain-containing protein [Desulfobulbaceae bacterium]